MLSSLGFDNKGAARNPRNGSKYMLEVPRGFSVHVFKNPAPSPVPPAAGKVEFSQSRSSGNTWSKPPAHASRTDSERKQTLTAAPESHHPLSVYAPVFEPKRSKSTRAYGIYPTAIPDTYIYERSLSSASDILASPASSSSSDSDFNSESVVSLSLEISSTRASSSTETLLETTALTPHNVRDIAVPPPGPIRSSASTSPGAQPRPTAVDLTRSSSRSPSAGIPLQPKLQPFPSTTPSRHTTVETVSDDDSDTVISEDAHNQSIVEPSIRYSPNQHGVTTDSSRSLGTSLPLSTPIRSTAADERSAVHTQYGDVRTATTRNTTAIPLGHRSRSSSPRNEELRAPPGLSRGSSSRPSANSSPTFHHPSPDQSIPHGVLESALAVATRRCVRWTENLVCPSPIPKGQRRKGWYNRRGDQLWTNDGRFKSPEAGQEYPLDLSGYPDTSTGWMNEDGVRIDMQHRLIPKPPLRSALKRPKISTSQVPEQIMISNSTIA